MPVAMAAPMMAGSNAVSTARGFALEMTTPRAQPAASFDAVWPSTPDSDIAAPPLFADAPNSVLFTQPAYAIAGLRVTLPSNGAVLATMCAESPRLCVPVDADPADTGHAWSGHVIAQDESAQTAFGDASAFAMNNGTDNAFVTSGSGAIDASLRTTLTQAGFPTHVAMQIERMFGGRLDLDAKAQPGDAFRIVVDSSDVRPGEHAQPRIATVEIRLGGRTFDALWFAAPGEPAGRYYTFDGTLLADEPFAMPLNYQRVSSPFGMRVHPVFGEPRFHTGVDLTASIGTPVYAAASGIVESIRAGHGYGKNIVLRHADGYATYYAHLSMFARGLKAGDAVGQGQAIGFVGRTGTTTGPHLHFEVRLNDRPLDPLTLTSHRFVAPLAGASRVAFDATVDAARQRLAALPSAGVSMASVTQPSRRF